MVDREAALLLPLVDHLMEQRVEGFIPPVTPHMPPADRNGGSSPRRGRGVMAQPRSHPARHENPDPRQRPAKALLVEPPMLGGEPVHHWTVVRVQPLRPARARFAPWYGPREDTLPRNAAFHTPAADEHHDRAEQLVRRGGESALHPQLVPLEGDEHAAIRGQRDALYSPQAEPSQARQELVRRIEAELELRRIGRQAETREERANCCTCSGWNSRRAATHIYGTTLMWAGVMVRLKNDDGRLARDRLDRVPAVHTTIPCSRSAGWTASW